MKTQEKMHSQPTEPVALPVGQEHYPPLVSTRKVQAALTFSLEKAPAFSAYARQKQGVTVLSEREDWAFDDTEQEGPPIVRFVVGAEQADDLFWLGLHFERQRLAPFSSLASEENAGQKQGALPLELLDRDTPGIFQLWQDDVAELLVNPGNLGGIGACEPEQLEVMNVASIEALANIILGLYHQWYAGNSDWVVMAEKAVDGEIDDKTLERGENKFATYLTFDCRAWLKPEAQEGGQAHD